MYYLQNTFCQRIQKMLIKMYLKMAKLAIKEIVIG